MVELSKRGYTKQAIIHIRNKDFESAYRLTKEFVERYDKEMIAHFLLAKSAFWLDRFDEAAGEARKAFNLAKKEDMATCAILAGTAYFELKEYRKGLELLKEVEGMGKTEGLEELLFLFSMAAEDPEGAAKHLGDLYDLNRERTDKIYKRFLAS